LIRRFIDPLAVFLFVEPDQVADLRQREGAIGFDDPGATYPHKDDKGRCSFEALLTVKPAINGRQHDQGEECATHDAVNDDRDERPLH
jgi:chromate resistance exported protein